jgi:hypothetical protein
MTERIHILRCALCKKSFSFIPQPTDKARPDTPDLICDFCFNLLNEEERNEHQHG